MTGRHMALPPRVSTVSTSGSTFTIGSNNIMSNSPIFDIHEILSSIFGFLFTLPDVDAAGEPYMNVHRRNHQLLTLQLVSKQFCEVIKSTPRLWNIIVIDIGQFIGFSNAQERADAYLVSHLEKGRALDRSLRIMHIENPFCYCWGGRGHGSCPQCAIMEISSKLLAIRLAKIRYLRAVELELHSEQLRPLLTRENLSVLGKISKLVLHLTGPHSDIRRILRRIPYPSKWKTLQISYANLAWLATDDKSPRFPYLRKLDLRDSGSYDYEFLARVLFLHCPLLEILLWEGDTPCDMTQTGFRPLPVAKIVHRQLQVLKFVVKDLEMVKPILNHFHLPSLHTFVLEILGFEERKKEFKEIIETLLDGHPVEPQVSDSIWPSRLKDLQHHFTDTFPEYPSST